MGYVGGTGGGNRRCFRWRLDELMAPEEHPVRVIDAFVAGLDLGKLGFAEAQLASTGRPPYDSGDLLRLYLYGYLNQVRSSRRLERKRCASGAAMASRPAAIAPPPPQFTVADPRRIPAWPTPACLRQ